MSSEHAQAVRVALKTAAEFKNLFDSLGSEEHPRGGILTAYRIARKALREDLDSGNAQGALEILQELKRQILTEAKRVLTEANRLGLNQAETMAEIHDLTAAVALTTESRALQGAAENAIVDALDAQLNRVWALIVTKNIDDSLILGDAQRVGLLSPGEITTEVSRWITTVALSRYSDSVERSVHVHRVAVAEFKRQAVAALDERTTDCCLRVHGQVVGLNEDFRLTGTPRFADRLRNPPFHWYAIVAGEMCLTSEGYRPIESVKVGDWVLTHQRRFMPVTMALARRYSGGGLLVETDGGKVRITPEHPVLTRRGWIKAGTLRIGDVIIGCNEFKKYATRWSKSLRMMMINLDANHFYSRAFNYFVALFVGVLPGVMSTLVNFKFYIQTRKIKIKNVFREGLLKFKINSLFESHEFESIAISEFASRWIRSIGGGAANRALFWNAGHMYGVAGFHAGRRAWISGAPSGMNVALPSSGSRFFYPASHNIGFLQSAVDYITRYAKVIGNFPFRFTRSVSRNNLFGINLKSQRHDNTLIQRHYTIKKIVALELSDAIICDLSVEGDESYCIENHFVHNCRTATALVRSEHADDDLSAEMRNAARAELQAREETGTRVEIHPASATSRRS